MPAVIYQTINAGGNATDEDVWGKHWATCDMDREVQICAQREISEPIVSILRTLDNPLVVDCGCGPGIWVEHLRKQGFKNVVGVDSFTPVLEILTERGGRGVEGDVRQLPFQNESVDACVSLGVVEHFPEDPTACLREMARILVPGGYLFLTVPLNSWMRRLVAHPIRRVYRRLKGGSRQFFEYRFTDSEIVGFCRNSGFEVLRCSTDDYQPNNLSMGLWLDLPFFRAGKLGELNGTGALACKILRNVSPWLIAGGVFVIARKPKQAD